MESILRLREWMKSPCILLSAKTKEELNGILNAIEDEAMSQRTLGWNDGFDAGFASADDWLDRNERDMAEHGWVKLPLDADGVTIRVGDKVSTEEFGEVEVEGFIHNAVAFYNYEEQPARLCTIPTKLCHHHEPTVEDVLREFADKWLDADGYRCTKSEDAVVAEYAAKLQLKEG